MRPFHYERGRSVTTSIATHGGGKATEYLGGGTDLVELMKMDAVVPSRVVDVHRIDELRTIQVDDSFEDRRDFATSGDNASIGWRIGAAVTMAELAEHDGVAASHPLLRTALRKGATPQVRHLATLAGNLLQRTRCVYFRTGGFACNRRVPGSGCAALDGDHSSHAILGGSDRCIAVAPSDFAVACVAAGVEIELLGPDGARRRPVEGLHRLPGETPHEETELRPGELITHLIVPPHPGGGSAYEKVPAAGFAEASAAVALSLGPDGRVAMARIALGGLATVPWRAHAAEAALIGEQPTHQSTSAAADAELVAATTDGQTEHKRTLGGTVLSRAVVRAAERAGRSGAEGGTQ